MDHGSELKSSKSLPSSSSLGSSSHGLSQLDPKARATSFSFDEAGNDSNDTNGKVLNASTSFAPKVSDVADESMLQNWSPTQSPPIQVMEKPGDFDSNRISSTSDPSTPDSFSFETWSDNKDTNGTHSKLEGALNASISSASKTSDVANESELQNVSPTHSPTIQVMENPGGFETNGIPPSNSMSKSSKPEWSNVSNESLFSIDIGHHSFSRDAILTTCGDSYKSGELDTLGELVRYRHTSLAPKGGENNKEAPDNGLGAGNTPRTTVIPVEPIKNGVDNQHMVPLGAGANAHSHLVGSRTSNKSVDLPMTTKSEPTGCKCCCAGCTCDYCYCSRPSQFIISSGAWLSCRGCCSCKWFSGLSFSCKCLHCCCKQPKCQGCCCGWPCFSCSCCKQPKCWGCSSCCKWPCLNCYSCKKPKCRCCKLPSLNCCCCESITCSCFYFKCPIWRSCRHSSFCCSGNCCAKSSQSSFDNLAKDGGRITRVAA